MSRLYAYNELLKLLTNIVVILLCYRSIFRTPRHAAAVIASMVLLTPPMYMLNLLAPINYVSILAGSVYLLPVCFIVRGPLGCKLFMFYAQLVVVNLLMLIASYAVEGIASYGSQAHAVWELSVLSVLYAVLIALAWRYGEAVSAQMFSGGVSAGLWYVFAALPFSGYMALKVLYCPAQGAAPLPFSPSPYFVLLPVFMFVGFVLLAVAIVTMNGRARVRLELRLAQDIVQSGRDHYTRLTDLSERVLMLRHDSKHALRAAEQMLADGNVEEARVLLGKLERQYDEGSVIEYCNSRAVNAYINSFRERCTQADTPFEVRLQLPKSGQIDDYELCVLLGNLLENAMDATQRLAPEARTIRLTTKLQGEQLGILVENSMLGDPPLVDGQLVSRKAQGGLGIISMQAVARRYSGGYYPEWGDGRFRAYVTLSLYEPRA